MLEAEFTFPYLAHAPMEPLNAVIELRPGGAEIWSGCQTHSADAHFAAKVLGLAPEQVKINTLLGGGSFGRRGDPLGDWIGELAEIAKAIGGRSPVHVVWTREDDIKGGYYRPLALHRVKVGLDAAGQLSGWQHKVVCQSLFEGTPLEEEIAKDGFDRGSVGGLADTPYDIPDFSVESYNAQSPVPVLCVALRRPQSHGSRHRDDARRASAPQPERTPSRSAATCSPSTLAILSS